MIIFISWNGWKAAEVSQTATHFWSFKTALQPLSSPIKVKKKEKRKHEVAPRSSSSVILSSFEISWGFLDYILIYFSCLGGCCGAVVLLHKRFARLSTEENRNIPLEIFTPKEIHPFPYNRTGLHTVLSGSHFTATTVFVDPSRLTICSDYSYWIL